MSNAQRLSEEVLKVFNATQNVINGLGEGQRKQIKELVTDVSVATGMNANEILGFVSYFAHHIEPEAHVRRGAEGGLVKGARKVVAPKTPKAPKAAKAAPSAPAISDTASDAADDTASDSE